jgi:hypothetical protein
LPAETVTHGYNDDDELNALVGTYSYLQGTAYSAYNQVAQVQLGSAGSVSSGGMGRAAVRRAMGGPSVLCRVRRC